MFCIQQVPTLPVYLLSLHGIQGLLCGYTTQFVFKIRTLRILLVCQRHKFSPNCAPLMEIIIFIIIIVIISMSISPSSFSFIGYLLCARLSTDIISFDSQPYLQRVLLPHFIDGSLRWVLLFPFTCYKLGLTDIMIFTEITHVVKCRSSI